MEYNERKKKCINDATEAHNEKCKALVQKGINKCTMQDYAFIQEWNPEYLSNLMEARKNGVDIDIDYYALFV